MCEKDFIESQREEAVLAFKMKKFHTPSMPKGFLFLSQLSGTTGSFVSSSIASDYATLILCFFLFFVSDEIDAMIVMDL